MKILYKPIFKKHQILKLPLRRIIENYDGEQIGSDYEGGLTATESEHEESEEEEER